jgi:aminomethyltransferase
MNTKVEDDGRLVTGEPRSKPGDKIIFRAEMDLLCVASACPMDLTPTGSKGITDVDIFVANDMAELERALGV